ncbi:uncharacterized protein BDZ99DRAFT_203799 [Mytilinidion resinicola]|uniref:Uncharacterized protein n=1 Tax=Mytilinidion resinicola TaxID=574789 RepID=A0A6A6Y1Q2_9PEZI|nr:uncharacterized protein BDZ99DRAFT_203799 [Mytilinidion resinicola]KAF2802443.1 hypothetical protein BDZ99DRAFT_203799 [Mytilinidion resinicola]
MQQQRGICAGMPRSPVLAQAQPSPDRPPIERPPACPYPPASKGPLAQSDRAKEQPPAPDQAQGTPTCGSRRLFIAARPFNVVENCWITETACHQSDIFEFLAFPFFACRRLLPSLHSHCRKERCQMPVRPTLALPSLGQM